MLFFLLHMRLEGEQIAIFIDLIYVFDRERAWGRGRGRGRFPMGSGEPCVGLDQGTLGS